MIQGKRAALVAVAAVPIAGALVVAAGMETPAYDPITKTVSRLAMPGLPWATAVDIAIGLAALACLSLVIGLSAAARGARLTLVIAALGFTAAALIHLDPSSLAATVAHRLASGTAVAGLAVAAFAVGRRYGWISTIVGAAEVGMLTVALPLLATSFNAWGAWERVLLALALSWIVLVALKIVSSDESASATSPAASSQDRYEPVRNVISANR